MDLLNNERALHMIGVLASESAYYRSTSFISDDPEPRQVADKLVNSVKSSLEEWICSPSILLLSPRKQDLWLDYMRPAFINHAMTQNDEVIFNSLRSELAQNKLTLNTLIEAFLSSPDLPDGSSERNWPFGFECEYIKTEPTGAVLREWLLPAGYKDHATQITVPLFLFSPLSNRAERIRQWGLDFLPKYVEITQKIAELVAGRFLYIFPYISTSRRLFIGSDPLEAFQGCLAFYTSDRLSSSSLGILALHLLAQKIFRIFMEIERLTSERRALRGDLAASFSHQYVKQAAVLETTAKGFDEWLVKSAHCVQGHSAPNISQDLDSFLFHINVYKREMEIFADLSQSLFHFEPDNEAILQDCTPLMAYILRGITLAILVACDGEFKDRIDLVPPGSLLRRSFTLLDQALDNNVEKAWETLAQQSKVAFKWSAGSEKNICSTLVRPPEAIPNVAVDKLKTIFDKTMEKVFFEIGYNAVRNWSYTHRELYNSFPTFGKGNDLVFHMHLPFEKQNDMVEILITNTAFFSPGSEEAYGTFWEEANRDMTPTRPKDQQGVGGWGLYGNTVMAGLFRDSSLQGKARAGGRFSIFRQIEQPVDANTRTPYSYWYSSKLSLPASYFVWQEV